MTVVRKLSGHDGGRRANAGDQYRAVFEKMAEGLAICEGTRDENGRLVDYYVRDANPAFRRYRPQYVGRSVREVLGELHPRYLAACHAVLARGAPVRLEFWDQPSQCWIELHMTRLSDVEFVQLWVDITERKQGERDQHQLLDELNHRVKNNLTIVSGLLTMQARSSPDPGVREQLLKAVDRIQSIADLHALLYRGGRAAKDQIEVRGYLEELCARLSRTLFENRNLRIELHADPGTLPIEEAVRVGIIVNELVTNAAKHAYPADAQGVIWVSLVRAEDGVTLSVADVGRGLDETAGPPGIGMGLVRSLVEREGGAMTVKSGHGATIEVRLPSRNGIGPTQDSLL